MLNRTLLSTALFCLLCPLNAAAQEEELAPGFNQCIETSGTNLQMIDCTQHAYQYWDKILNENYRKVLKACDTVSRDPQLCRDRVRDGQRAWIKYRDGMAPAVWEMTGGASLSLLQELHFRTVESRRQARLLEELLP